MKYPTEEILEKITTNSLSRLEQKNLESWLLKSEKNKVQLKVLLKTFYLQKANNHEKAYKAFSEKYSNILKNKKRRSLYMYGIAASIIALIAFSIFINRSFIFKEEIANGLVLVTSDGKKINLDEINDSTLGIENSTISKAQNILDYTSISNNNEIKHNTLYIPYGRTFKLILSDSTKVYLNSGSKLTYPTCFISKERIVNLEGEGYFEVTTNKKVPFIVNTNTIKTQVFGTRFNVNAYKNNLVQKVSLIEGSVGVSQISASNLELIKPNQQYIWDLTQKTRSISDVNSLQFIDWIDGSLKFENESLENIIKRLERKYDIEITCNSNQLKNKKFTGTFKNESISQILRIIKETNPLNYIINKKTKQVMITEKKTK